ncbi:MAG: hypothetical protein LBS09_07830 [Bacteroidales bacterium]|jgi:hypothetical protein|nr:hypothetical protein [Bacteroidales bacterium]
MKAILPFAGCVVMCFSLCGCKKSTEYSEIPEIHFLQMEMNMDSVDGLGEKLKKVYLTFSFIDGDGDLGVREGMPVISKIHYSWMKKTSGGQYEAYVFSNGNTVETFEIPYDDNVMNKDDAYNKLLKGSMKAVLDVPYGPSAAGMDTVHIRFFIFDRALHQSNTEITPDFSILDDSVKIEQP